MCAHCRCDNMGSVVFRHERKSANQERRGQSAAAADLLSHMSEQSIFGEQNYNKPFLVTYLSTATFSFYLIPFLCLAKRKDEFSPEEYAKSVDY